MNFEQFSTTVVAAGLVPRECSPHHWQILGGKSAVNFYPDTKRGDRFYVDHAERGASGSLDRALKAAVGQVTVPMRKQPKRPTKPRQITNDLESRWQQHRSDGGKLTREQFAERKGRKQPVAEAIAPQQPAEVLKDAIDAARAVFAFALDGDGDISREDVQSAFHKLGEAKAALYSLGILQ